MTEATTEQGLKRVIGVLGLATTIVSITIGAGIFVLPAIVSTQIGAFGLFTYLFCGVMLALIMLCYAETGSRITSPGGSYAYVEAAFGDFAGFIINWLMVLAWSILADAALLNVVADSLAVMFPVFTNSWIRALLFFVLLGSTVWVNIRGAKNGMLFVKLLTLIKLLPLFAIIVFGFGKINAANLRWEHLPSIKTFGNTALVLFFAFAGFESALGVSGEIKNPKRTIPLGILLGGSFVLIIYILLQLVSQGVLGPEIITYKDGPLAAVAGRIVGPIGGTILLITAAISCFGAVSGDILNTPRLLFAGARDGVLPKFLGKAHPRFATPYLAIACFGLLIFLFSIAGGFQQLAILASAAILLVYLAVVLATIKLRRTKQEPDKKTFRIPGGLLVPVAAIAAIGWLLSSLGRTEILSTLAFIAAGCLLHFVMRRWKKQPPVFDIPEQLPPTGMPSVNGPQMP